MIEFFESLRKIETIMMRAIGPKLHELGFSKADIFILARVHFKKEARMSELARMVGIPASSVTGIVDRLEKRNLVIRENDLVDRRSIIIRGTPELSKVAEHIFSIGNDVFAELLKPAPEELVTRISEDLDKLYGYISQENNDGDSVKK